MKKIWKIYGKGVDIVVLKCYTITKLRICQLGHEQKGKGKEMKFQDGMEVTTSDGYTRTLTRWTKYGKDRVYINGGSRSGDGFVDLVSKKAFLNGSLKYQKEIADMILDMDFSCEDAVETEEKPLDAMSHKELAEEFREVSEAKKEMIAEKEAIDKLRIEKRSTLTEEERNILSEKSDELFIEIKAMSKRMTEIRIAASLKKGEKRNGI